MPRKPVKLEFKIWCCSCSCCGYLGTFQVYHGASRDLVTGRKVRKRFNKESSWQSGSSLCGS